jgi:DNA-directed RNA polymerase subunit RPC12/RpoP
MYICDGCGNSNLVLEDGINNCPECGRVIIVRSFKSSSPIYLLPQELSEKSDVLGLARVLTQMIKSIDEFDILISTSTPYRSNILDRGNLRLRIADLAKLYVRFHNGWSKDRQRLIDWYDFKTTP